MTKDKFEEIVKAQQQQRTQGLILGLIKAQRETTKAIFGENKVESNSNPSQFLSGSAEKINQIYNGNIRTEQPTQSKFLSGFDRIVKETMENNIAGYVAYKKIEPEVKTE